MSFVPCWLESFSFFYTKTRLWIFIFQYLNVGSVVLEQRKAEYYNLMHRPAVLQYVLSLCRHAEHFSFSFFCLSSICNLHGKGSLSFCSLFCFASVGTSLLFNFLSFCLYCMYFFKRLLRQTAKVWLCPWKRQDLYIYRLSSTLCNCGVVFVMHLYYWSTQ